MKEDTKLDNVGLIAGAHDSDVGKTETKKVEANKFGDFVDVICYNCGNPRHHKASCKKPKICFICKKEGHLVDLYPVKSKGHSCATYVGSSTSGLGFYNVEVPAVEEGPVMDFTNCGLVYVETGDITMEELQLELATCFILIGHGR
jgi:hypothetical protein